MSAGPSGTVTVLFTDIEGSTRLWEERPAEMREALALHGDVLRAAVESVSGSCSPPTVTGSRGGRMRPSRRRG
jgi:class 3 adenylate cyclase